MGERDGGMERWGDGEWGLSGRVGGGEEKGGGGVGGPCGEESENASGCECQWLRESENASGCARSGIKEMITCPCRRL